MLGPPPSVAITKISHQVTLSTFTTITSTAARLKPRPVYLVVKTTPSLKMTRVLRLTKYSVTFPRPSVPTGSILMSDSSLALQGPCKRV